jgi:hypothetical protein
MTAGGGKKGKEPVRDEIYRYTLTEPLSEET